MIKNHNRFLVLGFLATACCLDVAACTSAAEDTSGAGGSTSSAATTGSGGSTSSAATTGSGGSADAGPIISQFELRNAMRQLWQDHVAWTRVFLISTIGGLPDAPAATTRLLQNQTDIGNAIKPFYGEAAGEALEALLLDHITGAAALVAAAKGGDMVEIATAKTAWYANADEIAVFLADANPNWPVADLRMMMKMHLDQTLAEATARLTADWAGDVEAYDEIVAHITTMADALTDGITKQFPDAVSTTPAMTVKEAALHHGMRALWQDHVLWTRVFLISAIAGLADAPEATARLLKNQTDIGNAIKPFYGAPAGDALTTLLEDHITSAATLVGAAKGGDAGEIATAKAAWYANADDIAVFLANANPNWPVADLKMMMKMHLDQTLAEATARLTADWTADVKAYDEIELHILVMADALSSGIAKQFPGELD